MRVIIAGILGGIVMFIWGALSHMVFQIGDSGIAPLPNEDAVISALRTNVKEPGVYFFPGMDMKAELTPEQEAAWTEKYKAGPVGLIVYRPVGQEPMTPKMLGVELGSNILACLLAAFVLAMGIPSFIKKVIAATLIGVIGWMSIVASYWNFYGFSDKFVLAELCDQVIGWLLAGIAIAFIVRARPTAASMD
jgi:hypothetical protein